MPEPEVFFKQIFSYGPTSYWICVTFNGNSPKSAWCRWNLFQYSCPFGIQPLGHSSSQDESCMLSSLQVSLFSLKVLVFHWSCHCWRVFDVSRRDGSESSPVSFHGPLKVDFAPVSVKLGLIATTGATHSTHTHTHILKVCISLQSCTVFLGGKGSLMWPPKPFVCSFIFFLWPRGMPGEICCKCSMFRSVE